MKRYHVTVPARVNVLGNPADGNEGDLYTISAAIEVRAGALVEPADILQFTECRRAPGGNLVCCGQVEDADVALALDGRANLQKAAVRQLRRYSREFAAKLERQKVRVATWTDVPRQSGLGGSSLLVILTLAALRAAYELDPLLHNDYVLAELTQRAEANELGITCGYADRYVPIFGGLSYVDYRGKLFQGSLNEEPYATYERLDAYVSELPLVVCSTGVVRDSGDVHGVMRSRYLQEYAAWERRNGAGNGQPFMLRTMEAVGATAWRGKIALLRGDWDTFGALMNENHHLVNEMMLYCGFNDGAGDAGNRLIRAALDAGALGAKLTGAGGGGSVFALARPGEQERIAAVFRQAAAEAGLREATVFVPALARQGLVVEEIKASEVLSLRHQTSEVSETSEV